jgi:multimeric flavodoxin WrbA
MTVRTGQAPEKLAREDFGRRFREHFDDPLFDVAAAAVATLEQIAWDAYHEGRKAPRKQLAGAGFAHPDEELSVAWLDTRRRLRAAAVLQADPTSASRVLVVCASARNDGTCPSEMSKTHRLVEVAREVLGGPEGCEVDVLDLSRLSSEYGRHIHPCKACVSTAMPLCHWPCSCYPNQSLGQTSDWMNDIYERWTAAHAVVILTPVYWYQAPSGLKLMIDRLVCADGGNPDPTTTKGKDPELAKALERKGWDYPQHLAGRAFGVVVHGDVEGVKEVRRALCDWLESMGLVDAGAFAKLDRYIGYFGTYADSHEALDRDEALVEEVRNVARSVGAAVRELRQRHSPRAEERLEAPRKK